MAIKITGCFSVTFSYNVLYRFAERSIVYLCYKAEKGILEKIAIKKVKIINNQVVYIDTYNAIYSDADLCTHDDAVATATAYLQARLDEVNALITASC